jgi:tRNA pseudouridine55 synthase
MTGIIVVDKPEGITSFDVVRQIRRAAGEKHVGHSGTLDPMATGVLAVFLGRATRAVDYAMNGTKRYRAKLRPGIVTDTQDITGNVIGKTDAAVSREQLQEVLPRFQGEIQQIPPMYAALRYKGKHLYEIARQGKTVPRPPRTITIYALRVCGEEDGDFLLDIECSKGTYIRTLCNDIGEALGCGACLAELCRTKNGPFSIKDAHPLQQILEDPESFLLPVDTIFADLPMLICSREQERRLRNGADSETETANGLYRVYSEEGRFLLLGYADEGILRTVKSFFIQ